jgi:hypothetical protein
VLPFSTNAAAGPSPEVAAKAADIFAQARPFRPSAVELARDLI